jgi:mannosyltransferase
MARALLPLAAFAFALATLVPGFWIPSLWTDEAATASAVRRSWEELFFMLGKVDVVHGLYYVLVKSLTDVVGVSEITLRAPSIAASAAGAAAVAAAGRRLGGPPIGLAASAILVLLPRFQFAGTDARSYAFTVFGAALCILFLARLRDEGRVRDVVGFGAAAAISTGFSFYCVLLVPVAVLAALLDRRLGPHWWKLAVAGIPAAAVAAFVAAIASHQTFQVAWIPPLDWHVGREMLLVQYFSHAAMWPDSGGIIPTSGTRLVVGMVVTAAVVLSLAAWGVFRRPRAATMAIGVTLVCVPAAVLVVGSALMGSSFYLPRYLTFTASGVCLLAALGLESLIRLGVARWVAAAAVVALVVGSGLAIAGQRTENGRSPSDDFRFVANTIRENASRGEAFAIAAGEDLFLAAYPEPFEGLVDLTRGISAAEWGLIFNQRFPIDSRADLVARQNVVWSISPIGKPEDEQYLSEHGFAERGRWTGTGHVIVRFVKS